MLTHSGRLDHLFQGKLSDFLPAVSSPKMEASSSNSTESTIKENSPFPLIVRKSKTVDEDLPPDAELSTECSEEPCTLFREPPLSIMPEAQAVRKFKSDRHRSSSTVLYSAISSLEDSETATGSFKSKRKNNGVQPTHFPSCTDLKMLTKGDKQHRRSQRRFKSISPSPRYSPSKSVRRKKSMLSEAFQADLKPAGDGLPDQLAASRSSGSLDGTINVSADSRRRRRRRKGPTELFRPSSDAYTPRMTSRKDLKFKPAEKRSSVAQIASTMGTLSRPNVAGALRRVAMIIHQHIVKIERRFESPENRQNSKLFLESMSSVFHEDAFVTPIYRCTMGRIPTARPGMVFGLKQIRTPYRIPSESEIYEFATQLFDRVQLSSECSIVCLIYMERLMEQAKVPLLVSTWRPIFMCGLLLASKVWQDLSSWNIEFASVYPQFSLDAINRLELLFVKSMNWDMYISSTLYAKYYFALRSVVEKPDFRNRYNRMVGVVETNALSGKKVEQRSTQVKESLQLSSSL